MLNYFSASTSDFANDFNLWVMFNLCCLSTKLFEHQKQVTFYTVVQPLRKQWKSNLCTACDENRIEKTTRHIYTEEQLTYTNKDEEN